ncbi:hypothetical protein Back2_20770 [Nocardioides baekrokdamisoli]|uniref:Glycosyltransferase 2-like domain-containing protein n=1 Tax=Nocardioides baekrokdamisoli TaxID=1804624 RepID=A0A3G9IFG8_9ACTN|nr:glycosyltransferase family 2 protein [Nocardioides baekrokdamisoli]BBH17790.1 hypothetical protein Back2_20770 [Nocardioides baekrokdamisoli]
MKIALTMMVRDEADIIVPMLEFHLAQGVDVLLVTDNGSVDGTAEILQGYADKGLIVLAHDPVQRKQQSSLVTAMARRARTEFAADWVINADADEFLFPIDRTKTIKQCFEAMSRTAVSFYAPVTNYVGVPAQRGSGIDRLVYRDHRTEDELKSVGINSQPTPNCLHRGDPSVSVVQGNHFTDLAVAGEVPEGFEMEVLHLPWRSWEQFERKVTNAGAAYDANPDLTPSPNHHGMMDYRRWQAGRLRHSFVTRLPLRDALENDHETYTKDTSLMTYLHALVPHAVFPDLLAAALDSSKDEALTDEDHAHSADLAHQFMDLEGEIRELRQQVKDAEALAESYRLERDYARQQADKAIMNVPTRDLVGYTSRTLARKVVRRALGEVRRRRG